MFSSFSGSFSLGRRKRRIPETPLVYTPPTYVSSGLLAYYDPANTNSYSGSGSTITDLSGNNNDGTISGAAFNSATSTTHGYFAFDGTDDYIVTPNLYNASGNRSHTVEMWVYMNEANNCLWSEQDTNNPATSGYHYAGAQIIQSGPFHQVIGGVWTGSGIQRSVAASGSLTGSWQHVVKTYDHATTTVTAYVNAVTAGAATHQFYAQWDIGNGNNQYYAFGPSDATTYASSTADALDGRVGIVRIYDRALSSAEVTSNFDNAKSRYGYGPDGTAGNPAVSAQQLYDAGYTTSGWYYIQTSTMTSARQVYCNMDDEGGGWMLIGYTPGFTGTSVSGITAGLSYPNTWENGEGTFNRMRVSTMDLWYDNGTAQCSQVMKMVSTTASQDPLLANMDLANKVVYSNPDNLSLSTVSNYNAFVNNTPMTGTWSPIKGHTQMTTDLTVNAPGDWIYQASSWWTVCGPSTDLNATGRSGNAQGTGSWTNPATNNLYGMRDVVATTNSQRSDANSYAVYIK